MKKKIMKIIKNNNALYQVTKKIYNIVNISEVSNFDNKYIWFDEKVCYLTYFMENEVDFKKINAHYNKIKNQYKKLLIIIISEDFDLSIHKLFEENIDINVISMQYFIKYNKGLIPNDLILLDFKGNKKNHEKLFEIINRRG